MLKYKHQGFNQLINIICQYDIFQYVFTITESFFVFNILSKQKQT